MKKSIELFKELGFGVAEQPGGDDMRRESDAEWLRGMPLAEMTVSPADIDLIAREVSGAVDEVTCAMLMQVIKVKPLLERQGAAATMLMLLAYRMAEIVEKIDLASMDLVSQEATLETQRRGMSLEEVQRMGKSALREQIDAILSATLGRPFGVPKDGGAAEDEQIKRDLGR